MVVEIDEDACIACGLCVDACPVDALYLEGDFVQVYQDKCEGIGDCVAVCPVDALSCPGK